MRICVLEMPLPLRRGQGGSGAKEIPAFGQDSTPTPHGAVITGNQPGASESAAQSSPLQATGCSTAASAQTSCPGSLPHPSRAQVLDVAFPPPPRHPQSPPLALLQSSPSREFSAEQVQGQEASELFRPPGSRRGATHTWEGTGAEGEQIPL